MTAGTPSLSVIVACSRPRAAVACLRGLEGQRGDHDFEVLVAGQVAGIDRHRFALDLTLLPSAKSHPNVRRNLGLAHARSRRIALLDDDTVPDPGWVAAAVAGCDPAGSMVLTGPERPVADGPWSRLAHAVSASRLAEGTRAHVCVEARTVGWSEVPFCNCVLPRRLLDRVGPFSPAVPWDMDDFEFCFRVRREAVFLNVPGLSIRHDRYPTSVRAFLAYKWRLRVRTGEKLVSHPGIYGRVAPVVAAAVAPWVVASAAAGAALVASGAGVAGIAAAGTTIYCTALLSELASARASGAPARYLGLLAMLHAVTVAGVQVGLFRGLWRRGRAAAGAEAEAEVADHRAASRG